MLNHQEFHDMLITLKDQAEAEEERCKQQGLKDFMPFNRGQAAAFTLCAKWFKEEFLL